MLKESKIKLKVHKSNNKHGDIPNKFANLGFRFVFSLVGWIILITTANDSNGYFVAQTMFCIPLFKEFVEFLPPTKIRNSIRGVALLVSLFCLTLSLLGVFGILTIHLIDDLAYISIVSNRLFEADLKIRLFRLWVTVGLLPSLTLIDWICSMTKEESKFLGDLV